ncbi:MAG: hypothetical protein U1E47_06790 [Rivihabitans pingtungensis]
MVEHADGHFAPRSERGAAVVEHALVFEAAPGALMWMMTPSMAENSKRFSLLPTLIPFSMVGSSSMRATFGPGVAPQDDDHARPG